MPSVLSKLQTLFQYSTSFRINFLFLYIMVTHTGFYTLINIFNNGLILWNVLFCHSLMMRHCQPWVHLHPWTSFSFESLRSWLQFEIFLTTLLIKLMII